MDDTYKALATRALDYAIQWRWLQPVAEQIIVFPLDMARLIADYVVDPDMRLFEKYMYRAFYQKEVRWPTLEIDRLLFAFLSAWNGWTHRWLSGIFLCHQRSSHYSRLDIYIFGALWEQNDNCHRPICFYRAICECGDPLTHEQLAQ